MTRWFRFYDDAVNDPKVQRLPGEKFKAWVNLLCLASKNDGVLPPLTDISFSLRMTEDKVSSLLNEFCSLLLLDPVEVSDAPMSYEPHNWDARQYKSDTKDPTAPQRNKRYRDRKRNDRIATVTLTPTRAETEQTQNRTEPDTRDDLKIRTGNFQQAIVKAFADGNSPNLPETSRAGLWLTQGYQEDICLAVIAEIVRKKPSITTLNYFDNAIREAHASKAPPRQAVPLTAEQVNWDDVLSTYKKIGHWSKWAGPGLDSPACRAPAEMLAKYDLRGAHEGLPAPPVNLRAMQ